jgi:hypothetical protein
MNNLRLTVWALLTIALSLVATGAKADCMLVNDFSTDEKYDSFPWKETFSNATLNPSGNIITANHGWTTSNCAAYNRSVRVGYGNTKGYVEKMIYFHTNHEYKIVYWIDGLEMQASNMHTIGRFSVLGEGEDRYLTDNVSFCHKFETVPGKWRQDSCIFVPPTVNSRICFSSLSQDNEEKAQDYYIGPLTIYDLGEFVTVNAKYGCTSVYYGDKNLIVPEGYTAATYRVENNNLQVSKLYKEGDIIAKGTGFVLFGPKSENVHLIVTDKEGVGDSNNMLHGSDAESKPSDSYQNGCFYVLSHGYSSKDIGFHWKMNNGSGDFTMPAHKAYLFVPSSTSIKVKAQYVMGNATGLSAITQDRPSNRTFYNLSGQQVDEHYHGLVIYGGKKFYQN